MIKSTVLAAAAIAASLFASQPNEAKAGDITFQLGVAGPHYGYSLGYNTAPVHYYEPRQYAPHQYAPRQYAPRPGYLPYYRPAPVQSGISCHRARNILYSKGFHNIQTADCRGPRYGFRASRYGKRFYISVSSRTGQVIGKVGI